MWWFAMRRTLDAARRPGRGSGHPEGSRAGGQGARHRPERLSVGSHQRVSVDGLHADLGRLVDRNVGMVEVGAGPDLPEGPQQIETANVADEAHVQQPVVGNGIRADPHPAAE